jgi:hypothetical protein
MTNERIPINYMSPFVTSEKTEYKVTIGNSSSLPPCLSVAAETRVFTSSQLSVFVSMENAFRNQLVSKNHSLRGNVFVTSFPRNGSHVTVMVYLQADHIFLPITYLLTIHDHFTHHVRCYVKSAVESAYLNDLRINYCSGNSSE